MSGDAPRRGASRLVLAALLIVVAVGAAGQETEQGEPAQEAEGEGVPAAPEHEQEPAGQNEKEPDPVPPPPRAAADVLKELCELDGNLAAPLLEVLGQVENVRWSDLPPVFLDKGSTSFEELEESFAGCRARVEAELAEERDDAIQEALALVVKGREAAAGARHHFERETHLRDELRARLADLAGIETLPLTGEDWPPADLCASCADLREALEKARRLAGQGVAEPEPRLDSVVKSIQAFHERKKALCGARRSILAVSPDVLDLTARYYSWTQSWQSFREIHRRLSSPTFQAWCR